MGCDRCGDQPPPDARFCINCGTALAATEETTRLGEAVCPDCHAGNPGDAWSCANCGRRLAIGSVAQYQPAPACDSGSKNWASDADPSWLGELLLVAIELIGWAVVS